jgi:hypothetical protein
VISFDQQARCNSEKNGHCIIYAMFRLSQRDSALNLRSPNKGKEKLHIDALMLLILKTNRDIMSQYCIILAGEWCFGDEINMLNGL